jgi:hypothetical protein
MMIALKRCDPDYTGNRTVLCLDAKASLLLSYRLSPFPNLFSAQAAEKLKLLIVYGESLFIWNII